MATVILVVHLMIAAALVGVVLMQKSEGGALGMGSGGGGGGFLTGRGTANLLTRTTAALAAAFFLTSVTLTLIANHRTGAPSVLDQGKPAAGTSAPAAADKPAEGTAPAGRGGILDKLQGGGGPQVPRSN
ncbi:MAG: preprotein translocase subunit SecG [Hyphomicrobiaceae bacterium]|nr:preprotein translocase subunit SecG [Hyphomicrobiaceae bacterium]